MGGDFDELYLLSKCGFKYWFCTYLMHCEVINVSFMNVKEIIIFSVTRLELFRHYLL